MMKNYAIWGLVMLLGMGGVGSILAQEVDPAEVQRRMEIYMRDDPAEKPTIDYDHEAWKAATECGKAACFRAYLEDYPKGRYAKMARARLEPESESKPESRPLAVTEQPTPVVRSNQRFTDNNDGTVTDNKSGLIWLKNANCFDQKDWSTAMASAQSLTSGTCGLRDRSVAGQWRLPTKEEWEALIDQNARNPALPAGHPFTGVQFNRYYWSYAPYAPDNGYAWVVYLYDGLVSASVKAANRYVWPVRNGQ